MGVRVLVPVVTFVPWVRATARTVVEIESADSVVVELLYIFEEEEWKTIATNHDLGKSADINVLAGRKSKTADTAEIFDSAGFDYEISGVQSTEPGREILNFSDMKDVDRIYLYSRNRSPVGKAVFGSDLQDVLSNASVPVVVLPADASMGGADQTAL